MPGGDVFALAILAASAILGYLVARWWLLAAVGGVWLAYIGLIEATTAPYERAELELLFLLSATILTVLTAAVGIGARKLVPRQAARR